jgi:hypothetical protein
MLDQLLNKHLQLWAHSPNCCNFAAGLRFPVVVSVYAAVTSSGIGW